MQDLSQLQHPLRRKNQRTQPLETMHGTQRNASFLPDDWRRLALEKTIVAYPNCSNRQPINPSAQRLTAASRSGKTMAATLLGEDGRGYELARRLEACGAWRAWLGEAAYAVFSPALLSPSAWDAFLSPRSAAGVGSASQARAQIQLQLQLRARALLYDKASAALFLSQSHSINDINPNFLQLHGDDVYFSLDEEKDDGTQLQCQSAFNTRYNESDNSNKWPSTWYKQFAEKFRIRHHKLPSGEKEITKRSSEGMLTYLKLCTVHKRKRQVFKDYQSPGEPISLTDETLFPEILFPSDCVPDSALPKADGSAKRAKMEFHTVLDNLPGLTNRSPAMIERFGIMPEYYKVGNKYRGKKDAYGGETTKWLSDDQENLLAKKAVVRLVSGTGFESATAGSVDIFGDVLQRHVGKLGKLLKILCDGYRKECSSVELLKMFVQSSGHSIAALAEMTKIGSNNNNSNNNHNHSRAAIAHQMQQQHAHPLQSQQQNNMLAQQMQRQFLPQTLAFQQQQQIQQLRRNNTTTANNNINNNSQMNSPSPRGSVMMMDNKTHNSLVDVKIESTPMDLTQQQQQLRYQQQQQMMMANNNNNIVQSGSQVQQQQFRPMQSVQISQFQPQNVYGMRTAPVKVEAFHELVSGDNEHNKLTSPSK